MNKKARGMFSKILALFLVIFILGILLISGPAQAFILKMDIDKNVVKRGENIKFDVSVKIDQSDGTLPVQQLILVLDGPIQRSCVFNPEGQIIGGCIGIVNITKTTNNTYEYGQNSLYGYGYGYTTGELNYTIELDSSTYAPGIYNSVLIVEVANNYYNYQGDKINIQSSSSLEDRGNTTKSFDSITGSGSEGDTLILLPGSLYTLKIKGEEHTIQVNSIDNEKIDLTLSSDPQDLSLVPGEIYNVDLENDSENDLMISVWYLNNKEAVLHFESERTIILEKVPVKEKKLEQSFLPQLPKENILEKEPEKSSLGINFLMIFLGILVFIEIIGILLAFLRR